MNKTININLGGYFFHIDESAYQKLRRYLDAISKSLSDDPQGKNEIISDIETRISELLSEKITDARQVVNEQDISDIIKIMGEPEDYAESEDGYADSSYSYQRRRTNSKKLFRDGDNKFFGGVASGIAHYSDVDLIWIRLLFILTAIFSGIGFFVYIVLWIIVPEAKTTAEKLQMEGEAVNIDNIEKKIREEFKNAKEFVKEGAENISEKFSNADYKKYGTRAKSGFQEFLDTIGKIIVGIFSVIGKFIGVLIIIVSAAVLISFIIALFSLGSVEILGFGNDFVHLPPFMSNSIIPYWLLTICILVLVGFPFLILFVLGLRILSSNVKQFSKTTSLTMLGVWIVALLMIVFTVIEFQTSKAFNGYKIETTDLVIAQSDTLKITVENDDNLFYNSTLRRRYNKEEVYQGDIKKLYSNNVRLNVEESDSEKAYVHIRKRSEGRNNSLANKSAESLEYNFDIVDNKIVFDAYFLSNYKNIIKQEVVYATLFVPEGITVYFDDTTKGFLNNVSNTDDIQDRDMVDHYFLMTSDGLDCTDCDVEDE